MAKEYHMAGKKGRIQDVAAAEALAKEGQMSETNEDTGLAVEDTNFAVEDTRLATKDIVPTTGKEFVVPPLDEVRAAPSIGGSVDETIVETSVDPMAGIVEAALAEDFEVLEELGKEGLKAAKSAASSFFGSFRMFATETRDYTKNCFESRAAFVGALLDAKCLQSVVRIQTGYAV
jgi:Phasin protein